MYITRQRNGVRPNSPTTSVNNRADIVMAVGPLGIITLDLVDVVKAKNDVYYIAVNTFGCKFKIPSSEITKRQDFYTSYWTDIEVPEDSVTYNTRMLYFRLLNHSIDVNGTLRKRRETEKYKKDLAKWQYAVRFNTKAKLLQNGNMIIVNDKLMYKAPKGCIEAIVPPKAELVDFSATQCDSTLKSVKFMSKIIIPACCFKSCKGLVNVEIHDGTSELQAGSFSICEGLEQITIPKSVHKIYTGCFAGCKNLKSVVFEGIVKHIGKSAFEGCSSLEEIRIPNGVSRIEKYTFEGCISLREVHIPITVKVIDKEAFTLCSSLREIHIPINVREIDKEAFRMCSSLEKLYLPETLKGKLTLETEAKIIFYK